MGILWLVACSFAPEWGFWTYTQTSVDEDSCGIEPYLDAPSATITLIEGEEGAFTVDDGTYQFGCQLDDLGFSCPDRWPETVPAGDTTLEADGEAHGEFETDLVAQGTQSGTFDCIDLGCEAAAAMLGMNPPCDLTVSFVITKDE